MKLVEIRWYFGRQKARIVYLARAYAWFFMGYRQFAYNLSNQFGIEQLTLFRPSYWKSGVRWFVGKQVIGKENRRVFVKTNGDLEVASREMHALSFLSMHRNAKRFIPTVVAFYADDESGFIGFEYEKGKTLNQFLSVHQNVLPTSVSLALLEDFIKILDILYTCDVVHRDVTPENILICSPEEGLYGVKLIDFAFSVVAKSAEYTPSLPEKTLSDLGGKYKPGEHHWDDAFSFYQIALCVTGQCRSGSLDSKLAEIKSRIGRLSYIGASV